MRSATASRAAAMRWGRPSGTRISTGPATYPAVLASGVLAAAACGSATEPATPTVATVAGTYTLRSVAGQGLPATVAMGVDVSTAASQASRTLDANGNCSESGTFAERFAPGQRALTFGGTVMLCSWTLSGRTITFRTVQDGLPNGGYATTTTATVGADGTLTERSAPAADGLHGPYVYPRVYGR